MHQSSIGSTCSRIASRLARSLEETAWVIDDDNVSGRLRRLISIRSRMHCWDRRAVAIEHAMHESCINILHQCYTIMNKSANKKEYRWVYVKTLNSCCSTVQNNSSGSISTGANFNIVALALKEKNMFRVNSLDWEKSGNIHVCHMGYFEGHVIIHSRLLCWRVIHHKAQLHTIACIHITKEHHEISCRGWNKGVWKARKCLAGHD